MILAAGAAALDCVWLVSFHPESARLILGVNLTVAIAAALGYIALATVARRRPEAVVFVVLVAVDSATIAVGLGNPVLGLVAIGYLLLLPMVVSLLIPWATKIHTAWMALHAALVIGYVVFAPVASVPGGARDQLLGLLVVALVVSHSGHVVGVRGRILNFNQIERIRALNREARRVRVRLDHLNDALEKTATTDALTGLGNRVALDAGLALARSGIQRHDERYGLLILDLDRFKSINDERGHLGGDDVLTATSRALLQHLRQGDSAYRYGGEEFIVLLRSTSSSGALAAAERIRAAIEDLHISNPGNSPYNRLTASVGVLSMGPDDLAADDASWLARADLALYRAKANGRNRCESAEPLVVPPFTSPPAGSAQLIPARGDRPVQTGTAAAFGATGISTSVR